MKRKPYARGIGGRPPKGWNKVSRPGWYISSGIYYPGYISLWGKIFWHPARATWYTNVREMVRGPWTKREPYNGFRRVREAMAFVEEQYKIRERRKTWHSLIK